MAEFLDDRRSYVVRRPRVELVARDICAQCHLLQQIVDGGLEDERTPAERAAPDAVSDAPLPAEDAAEPSDTLAAVRARGRLNCGVHEGLVGFAYTDNRGQWRGFDVDFCRATAAAVLGDPDAVRFVPLAIGAHALELGQAQLPVGGGEGGASAGAAPR